jgi:polar amino acid transport system substrate-binding protein
MIFSGQLEINTEGIMKRFLTIILALCVFVTFFSAGSVFAKDTVILANETNWLPYYGKDLKKGGYITEVIRQSFNRVGYSIEVKWLPWKRALSLAEKGKVHGLGGAYYTKDRAKNFYFSKSILTLQIVFMKKKGTNITYRNLRGLKGKRIGIGRGYAIPEKVQAAKYLTFDEAPDMEVNLKKLMAGRLDIILGTKQLNMYLVNTKYPQYRNKLEVTGKPVKNQTVHLAISKRASGNPSKIVKDFDKGLRMIQKDGTLKKIKQEFGF